MFTITRSFVAAAAFAVGSAAVPALAGPPLICHPFETRGGPLLAWNATGAGWNAPLASYNTAKLTVDVITLLDTGAPVLTRMENLRRATIYAQKDPVLARQLLEAVMSRSRVGGPQAWFDAGYLIESYRQAVPLRDKKDQPAWTAVDETIKTEGYGLVNKAMTTTGTPNAEMEFAASLMTRGAASAEHRARASAAAAKGSALAINLARY